MNNMDEFVRTWAGRCGFACLFFLIVDFLIGWYTLGIIMGICFLINMFIHKTL